MIYDVFIPCAQKDYSKIQYCVDGLKYLNPGPQNIYVASKHRINLPGVKWVDESAILPIQPNDINYRRPNWIFQQLLKLGQNVTHNSYFVIDSDVILLKELKLEYGKFFISNHKQYHVPYFNLLKRVVGIDRATDYSFISDMMLFDRSVVRRMTGNFMEFFGAINDNLSDDSLLGDYEWYGHFFAQTHFFKTQDIFVEMHGKFMPELWTPEEVQSIISKSNSDAVSIHSWT